MPRSKPDQILAYQWQDRRVSGQFLGTFPEPHPDRPFRYSRIFAGLDGRVWVSRFGQGLFCYDHAQWRSLSAVQQSISAFAWFQERLWMVGLRDEKLIVVQGDTWSSVHLPCTYVNHFDQDNAGRLWVATSDGLWSTHDGEDWEHTHLPGSNQRIRRVWCHNTSIWVQREGIDGYLRMFTGMYEDVHLPKKLGPGAHYAGVLCDAWDHTWVASAYGVWQSMSAEGWKKLPADGYLGSQGLFSYPTMMRKDDQDGLWFSGQDVLVYFQNASQGDTFLVRVGTPLVEQGPLCYSVFGSNSMDIDTAGRLWIVSMSGEIAWIDTKGPDYAYADEDQHDARSGRNSTLECEQWIVEIKDE
jgi:ligand-binding sensor domain-containing protein